MKTLVLESLFQKLVGWRPATLLKKRLQSRRFPVKFAKFFRTHFLQNTSSASFCLSVGCFCIFLKIFLKNFLNSYFTTLLWRINIFSSRHIVWCIKSGARLFMNLSSIVRFWSLEQYCSKHRFLDICWCAFNFLRINLRSLLWIPALTDIWSSLSVISILLLYETTSATN